MLSLLIFIDYKSTTFYTAMNQSWANIEYHHFGWRFSIDHTDCNLTYSDTWEYFNKTLCLAYAFQLATWNPITYIELVTFHWICVECRIYQMYWIFYLYLFDYSKDFFFVVGVTSHVEREFTIAFLSKLFCFHFVEITTVWRIDILVKSARTDNRPHNFNIIFELPISLTWNWSSNDTCDTELKAIPSFITSYEWMSSFE